MTINLRAI